MLFFTLVKVWYLIHNHKYEKCLLEIRSMERGICPIAVLYFAVKYVLSLTFKNFVGQQGYQCYHILGHVTSSVTWP